MSRYAVVHLVVSELTKPLIETQVLEHMRAQASMDGRARPASVTVVFLEPARIAGRRAARDRVRDLRERAPEVDVLLIPFLSRFQPAASAWAIAAFLRLRIARLPVVFHCRGENAVEWAAALQSCMGRPSAIVGDIRGLWPDELLHARGYEGPEQADDSALRAFHIAFARLHSGLAASDRVLCVSRPLSTRLQELGVSRDRIAVIPCCVPDIRWSPALRTSMRERLGLADRLVFAYAGSITRYQHIEDGLLPFFRAAAEEHPRAHLLALTEDPDAMRSLIERAGIAADRVTVIRASQREVGDLLCAADAGMLLRADSSTNRVSMPVKLGEYLASGAPVIVSRVPGWVDEIVGRAGAGISVEVFGVSPERLRIEAWRTCLELDRRGDELRAHALALCRAEFLWARHVGTVRDHYASAIADEEHLGTDAPDPAAASTERELHMRH